jgi:hypothetical protein
MEQKTRNRLRRQRAEFAVAFAHCTKKIANSQKGAKDAFSRRQNRVILPRHGPSWLTAMKTTTTLKNKTIWTTSVLGAAALSALTLQAQTTVVMPPPPPPVVAAPPPPPAAPPVVVRSPAPVQPSITVVAVPDAYVWDGDEYVGMVGSQYYYLAPNQVWIPLTSDRAVYFHDWEKHHKDWVKQAIKNEKYRRDAEGHEHPWKHHDHDDYDH